MSSHTIRQPRKVLHVLNSASGGAALSTLELIESSRQQGIAACAVCHDVGSRQERDRVRAATDGDVLFTTLYWWNKKIRVPQWKRPLSEARQLLHTGWTMRSTAQVTRFALARGVDLIHTNTLTTPEGGRAARRLGLPHVWHVRELVGPGNPFRLPYEGPSFGRYMDANCSMLVANSHASAETIRSWVSDDLLEVVPNGIDISRFQPRDGAAPPNRLVVAMVGNLTSRTKKHALFIEAASRVDRSLPIEWRIYGHDPSRGGTTQGDAYVDALHAQLAKTGIADRFNWPGYLSEPAQIMSQIDVLVHPADNESFGRIIVEAMAAGLPVVGVRGGGVSEIVDDGRTGFVADRDNPDALAARIEQLARDAQLRSSMGMAGRRRAETHYSLAACTAGVLRVYERAMSRPLARAGKVARHATAVPH